VFLENFVGPLPDGYTVRSRKFFACVGKACCNPADQRLQGPVVWTEVSACKKGHLLTADNVVIENRNGRLFKRCRIYRREACKDWQKQHSSPAEGGRKKRDCFRFCESSPFESFRDFWRACW
jgi:hypothetical protein